jgi:hypothetical protein
MSLSKSPKPLDQRVQENAEIKEAKKRARRLEQKRKYYYDAQDKKKAAAEEKIEEERIQLKRERALVDSDVWRQRPPGFLWLGEIAPGKDASSLSEVDAVCDRWLRVLGLKHEIETLAQREERIFYASQAIGHPYLNANTGELIDADAQPWRPEPSDGKRFEDVWIFLPGVTNTPASMPDLSGLPKAGVGDSKPKFEFTLAPKKAKPAVTVPDATGVKEQNPVGVSPDTYSDSNSGGMTFQEEKELLVRQELEREQRDFLRAQARLADGPVAFFESEIGTTN